MTLPDRITYCDECGWTGEVRETCPECELHERIRANAVEVWDNACQIADILRNSLFLLPYADKAREAIREWDNLTENITNP
jgi:hypothetical protein